jgi:hypothetical protein
MISLGYSSILLGCQLYLGAFENQGCTQKAILIREDYHKPFNFGDAILFRHTHIRKLLL